MPQSYLNIMVVVKVVLELMTMMQRAPSGSEQQRGHQQMVEAALVAALERALEVLDAVSVSTPRRRRRRWSRLQMNGELGADLSRGPRGN